MESFSKQKLQKENALTQSPDAQNMIVISSLMNFLQTLNFVKNIFQNMVKIELKMKSLSFFGPQKNDPYLGNKENHFEFSHLASQIATNETTITVSTLPTPPPQHQQQTPTQTAMI